MANITLYVPPGVSTVQVPGPALTIAADGTVSVPPGPQLIALLTAGCQYVSANTDVMYVPLPADLSGDLTSIVAAASPTSGTAMTVALQPSKPCKLQVRGVYSGAVANLSVTIVGVDGRGNTIAGEVVNVAAASSTTFTTLNAYAKVTSVTPNGTVTNVTTIGVGQSNAWALVLPPTFTDLVVYKEGLATGAAGIVATTVDEAVGTVDTVAGTIVPTTAPNGSTRSYFFWYSWNTLA
jgi:hypothetical protein